MHNALLLALLVTCKWPQFAGPFPVAALSKTAKTYEISISSVSGFPRKDIKAEPAIGPEVVAYAPLFAREFTLYPPALVKRCNLKQVVLCKKLTVYGQPRAAAPDVANGVLYLDVAPSYWRNEEYLCSVLHHDFFHMIDYESTKWRATDDRWTSLNPDGFRYRNGGASDQSFWSGTLTDLYPGFLNHYSTTNVIEDKAEVFANLITHLPYVERRMRDDAVVRAKVRLLKERLAGFCPDVKDEFWEKAKKITR
jgi:hypothetical protein